MPKPPVSAAAQAVLAKPNPAVLASVRPNGTPHSAAVWYEWVEERVLLNMDATRLRLDFLRKNPSASITAMDKENWFIHVTVAGTVTLEDDIELKTIDRLSQRYIDQPYPYRDSPRVTAWLEPTSWYQWDGNAYVKDLDAVG